MVRQLWAAGAGVLLGLLILAVMVRADEAAAVKAIEKLGGRVTRDANLPGKPVRRVDLCETKVTDAGLKKLKELKSLQTLWLVGTQVTDVGLKELKEHKNLQELLLCVTAVTDTGLKELKELRNLRRLALGFTQVTDAGMKELKDLKSLQSLHLNDTWITDLGLKKLKQLKNLKWLDLTGTKVTDAGVKELKAALPSLQILRWSLGCESAGHAGRGRLDDSPASSSCRTPSSTRLTAHAEGRIVCPAPFCWLRQACPRDGGRLAGCPFWSTQVLDNL